MNKSSKPSSSTVSAPVQSWSMESLDAVLSQLIVEHERLLALAIEHRAAISNADPAAMQFCLERQAASLERVQALELHRRQIVAALTKSNSATISSIAQSAPEPLRARLSLLAQKLRDLLNRLHREHASLREATLKLSDHMEGLMRQIYRRLSHAGTYGPRAVVETHAQVITALDVRS